MEPGEKAVDAQGEEEEEELDEEQEQEREREEDASSSSEEEERPPAVRARDYYKYTGVQRAARAVRRVRSGLGKVQQELRGRREQIQDYDWQSLRERLITPLTLLTLVLHAAVPLHLIYLSLSQ